ncbi:hypothetical protein VNI00_012439 [Paramarasmius palmivorus]|uniref:Uncharacterized protein n=1 Tax=Paramarasmius palmivorus TaxID=297713 RepID=A0AAW0C3W7_9AGAR
MQETEIIQPKPICNFALSLRERNRFNQDIQAWNDDAILAHDPSLGPLLLKAYYAYSPGELDNFVENQDYIDEVGRLPCHLRNEIETVRRMRRNGWWIRVSNEEMGTESCPIDIDEEPEDIKPVINPATQKTEFAGQRRNDTRRSLRPLVEPIEVTIKQEPDFDSEISSFPLCNNEPEDKPKPEPFLVQDPSEQNEDSDDDIDPNLICLVPSIEKGEDVSISKAKRPRSPSPDASTPHRSVKRRTTRHSGLRVNELITPE